ncbi:hypothetical protein PG988_012291 [Apiospora saccharicola]
MRLLFPLVVSYIALFVNASPLNLNPGHDVSYLQNSTQELVNRAGESDISSLFLIDDGPGGCTGQIDTLNFWLQEARELHSAILRAFKDAQGDVSLRLLWSTYLGLKFNPSTLELYPEVEDLQKIVEGYLSRVTDFLDNGRLQDPQKSNEKPRLFCSGDSFRQVGWDSVLKDHNGEEVVDEIDTETGYVKYTALRDFFWKPSKQGRSVWWSDTLMGYDFTTKHHPNICPPEDPEDPDDKKPTYGMTAHRIPKLKYKPPPDGSTTSYDFTYNIVDIYAATGSEDINKLKLNCRNPESYVFMAMAAYMYYNNPEGKERALYLGSWPGRARNRDD